MNWVHNNKLTNDWMNINNVIIIIRIVVAYTWTLTKGIKKSSINKNNHVNNELNKRKKINVLCCGWLLIV